MNVKDNRLKIFIYKFINGIPAYLFLISAVSLTKTIRQYQ